MRIAAYLFKLTYNIKEKQLDLFKGDAASNSASSSWKNYFTTYSLNEEYWHVIATFICLQTSECSLCFWWPIERKAKQLSKFPCSLIYLRYDSKWSNTNSHADVHTHIHEEHFEEHVQTSYPIWSCERLLTCRCSEQFSTVLFTVLSHLLLNHRLCALPLFRFF